MTFNNRGLTLLEVMIVTLLLAIMGTLTFVGIREAGKSKVRLERSLDATAAVRDALGIMSHDINLAFHWRDINDEIKKAIIDEARAKNKPIPPSLEDNPNRPPSAARIPVEKATGFWGDSSQLHMTTLSHVRRVKDAKESDQAEVGYFLKSIKGEDGETGQALVRRSSPVLDEDVTKGGDETILMTGVKKLKFSYLGPEKDADWQNDWKSYDTIDDKTRGKFPIAVEIQLETEKQGVKVALSTIAAIHMPNNDPIGKKKEAPVPQGPSLPGGGGGR